MTIAMRLAVGVLGSLLVMSGTPAEQEETSEAADLTYSELIGYGIISAYSTNILVQLGFTGRCLTQADAIEATNRNMAFVKVLQRYAHSLNRSSKTEDEKMKKFIAGLCDVTTYLEEQTKALKTWVEQPESKSAKGLYERDCGKVEKEIELLLKK